MADAKVFQFPTAAPEPEASVTERDEPKDFGDVRDDGLADLICQVEQMHDETSAKDLAVRLMVLGVNVRQFAERLMAVADDG